MRAPLLAMAIALALALQAQARDYGVMGALFPIEEPSVLDMIHARLSEMEANGELAAMEDEMKATARARIARPHPVMGLTTATTYATFTIDLSITVTEDLTDHRGVVFARAGQTINPLDHSRFDKRLVFIDGDDPDMVQFAVDLAAREPAKIILTNGAPLELTEAHQILFFFDQGGVLSERFQLRALPSVVSRADPVMRVEEIPVSVSEARKDPQ